MKNLDFKIKKIAEIFDAKLIGNKEVKITGISDIENAEKGENESNQHREERGHLPDGKERERGKGKRREEEREGACVLFLCLSLNNLRPSSSGLSS